MSKNNKFPAFLLDRLIDDPEIKETGVKFVVTFDQLKRSVEKDLERLLNSRRSISSSQVEDLPHVSKSVLCYGIEDFSAKTMLNVNDKKQIKERIIHSIAHHEPRLRNVEVNIDIENTSSHQLRFSIKAMLCVDPIREPIDFDAILFTTTQEYTVSQTRNVRS